MQEVSEALRYVAASPQLHRMRPLQRCCSTPRPKSCTAAGMPTQPPALHVFTSHLPTRSCQRYDTNLPECSDAARRPNSSSELATHSQYQHLTPTSFTFGQPHFRKRCVHFLYPPRATRGVNEYPSQRRGGWLVARAYGRYLQDRPGFTLTHREIGPPEGFAYFQYTLSYTGGEGAGQ